MLVKEWGKSDREKEFVEGEDIDEKVLGEGRRKVEDFAEGKRGGTIVDVAESALIAVVVVVVKGKSERIEAGAVGDIGENPMVLQLVSYLQQT